MWHWLWGFWTENVDVVTVSAVVYGATASATLSGPAGD